MEELWEFIPGYDKQYQVSTGGHIYSFKTNKILKQNITTQGYAKVNVIKNNKAKNIGVHRLVAETFISNPLNKPIVNHKDGNKANNYWLNLEWVTAEENTQHAVDIGIANSPRGERARSSKLNWKLVEEIRTKYKNGVDAHLLALEYKVVSSTLYNIINNKTWRIK
jgi:hypothetical protein